MKGKLRTKDVEGALSYFLRSSQERYRYIYTNLVDVLPDKAAAMQKIEMISSENGQAEYRIRKTARQQDK